MPLDQAAMNAMGLYSGYQNVPGYGWAYGGNMLSPNRVDMPTGMPTAVSRTPTRYNQRAPQAAAAPRQPQAYSQQFPMSPQLLAQYQNQGVSAKQEQEMQLAAMGRMERDSIAARGMSKPGGSVNLPETQQQQSARTSRQRGLQRTAQMAAQDAYYAPGPMTAANRQAIEMDPFYRDLYIANRMPTNQLPPGPSWQGTNDVDIYGRRLG